MRDFVEAQPVTDMLDVGAVTVVVVDVGSIEYAIADNEAGDDVIEFTAHAFVSVTVNCTSTEPAKSDDKGSKKLYLKVKELPWKVVSEVLICKFIEASTEKIQAGVPVTAVSH